MQGSGGRYGPMGLELAKGEGCGYDTRPPESEAFDGELQHERIQVRS
jgi:hypothetical protein